MSKHITQYLELVDISPVIPEENGGHIYLAVCENDLGDVTKTVIFGGDLALGEVCLQGCEGKCRRDKGNCPFSEIKIFPDENNPFTF